MHLLVGTIYRSAVAAANKEGNDERKAGGERDSS